ncbi:putative mitochondrial hypothetical protein [Leptomonas pyrrhocoris]|uniref:SET domain-containing protein n=1 Tax=Leptomonas pyrrhocoris TaxID=157538 RepID=A0A0N0DXS6_LEPPY|nr:putative mitochondrial hypothetical protein [Leptomonas pyrrhocoris]KPA83291.1 putative mitochondrial hypothetical protein [Leptomonas pyrrhocoris]|eukprot:XP_015661730.1 putative mitochondrial hypothetical protein [Leptomonas pyrrhocoris]
MALIGRLHGAQCTPLRQQLRHADGIRGVFSLKPLRRGELILSLPLRYCYFAQFGPDDKHRPDWASTPEGARQLRRWNRGVALLPETWTWLQRFSSDAPSDCVLLTSGVSAELPPTGRTSAHEEGNNDDVGLASPVVFSLTVSPVEAALATAIALRYFYRRALHLTPATRAEKHIGPPPNELADRFVDNLPVDLYLKWGVETLYGDPASGEAHVCVEQIAQNLRDAALTHANTEEYRFLDEFLSLFDDLLLVCLYVVRSRVLTVPLLGRTEARREEKVCSVFAPLLDGLNHQPLRPSAAVVVSLRRAHVVVRATRDVRRGEEITLDYRAAGPRACLPTHDDSSATSLPYAVRMDEDWAARYLMEEDRLVDD